VDDQGRFALTLSGQGRWFPHCGVPGCSEQPIYGLLFSETRLGHVHACPNHSRAILLWNRVTNVYPLGAGQWRNWCRECGLPTRTFHQRWW
jgi:hypothetical protein